MRIQKFQILILLLFSISNLAICQISSTYKIGSKKMFLIGSTNPISDDEILKLYMKNPNFYFENKINKFGEIEAMIIDPNRSNTIRKRDFNLRTKIGEKLLPFVFYSIGNQTFDSEKLIGEIAIIQFNLIVQKPFFTEKKLSDFNDFILETNKKLEVVGIALSESSKTEIEDELNIQKYNKIAIIPDARNFNERYLIEIFPSYILIDKFGKLVGYYSELGSLENDLVKLK